MSEPLTREEREWILAQKKEIDRQRANAALYREALAELARRPEICICAAVKTLDGQIIRGHRHNYCLATIAAMGLQRQTGPDAQGFMTSKNRFVTRWVGLQLQLDADIPSAAGEYRGDELYSEDLY